MRRIKVKSMQRSGTEAIRKQIQPSKPKREITNNTNSHITKRTFGQPSEPLFPKIGLSATETGLKSLRNGMWVIFYEFHIIVNL